MDINGNAETIAPNINVCPSLKQFNVAYMMQLVRKMRQAIINQTYPAFVLQFIKIQFPMGKIQSRSGGNSSKVPLWLETLTF